MITELMTNNYVGVALAPDFELNDGTDSDGDGEAGGGAGAGEAAAGAAGDKLKEKLRPLVTGLMQTGQMAGAWVVCTARCGQLR
jgi:hypothetical protein